MELKKVAIKVSLISLEVSLYLTRLTLTKLLMCVVGKLRGGDKSVGGSGSVTHANRAGGEQTTNIIATSHKSGALRKTM